MQDTTFTPNTGRRASTRTFNVLSVYRECGVTTDVEYNTVKLTRTATGLVAEINGEAAELDRAVGLLQNAERVWLLEEVLMLAPVPEVAVIGKPVAHQLHIELGTLGHRNHYRLASEALGRPVHSLAMITAEERAVVREYAYGQLGLQVGRWAA